MAFNWTTEWITHPDYPGWRKRRLVDPMTGAQAMLQTFWERIPGSDPNLPGPPGAEGGWGGIFPRRPRPDWGKRPELPEWPPRRKQPPLGSYPGDPEGREPKPYRPPLGTHEMPGIPDGFNPFLRPSPYRPPSPQWPPRIRPAPMPNIDPWANLPEYDPESKWYNPNWREDMERERGLPPGHLVHLVPPSQSERMREQFNLGGNFGDNNFSKLIKDAQVGAAMGRTGGLRRENMMIPPPMRKRYPAEFDTATGQNRVVPGTLRTTYADEGRVRGPQLGGVPEGDREFVDTMHAIQNAYFTGADFGYEEGWAERLGATQEQIDMFMAVPEEALQYAMDNPTDAVLQEFEEYYGFPLNVNDPDMQKYFRDRKKRR